MAKKHEHLLSNKIVLWSASGFAKAALEKRDSSGAMPWRNLLR
jgi:hypothetical protein